MKIIKFVIVFLCIFSLFGCGNDIDLPHEDFSDELVVGKDVLVDSEINEEILSEFYNMEKELKRKEIERRLALKKERQKAFENITFEYEYVISDDYMPYGLFTPSVIKYNNKTPLIVWLHGAGERGVGKELFNQRGLIPILSDWELNGFNAYVLCPQLNGVGYGKSWNNGYSRENLMSLIEYFKDNYNIDENKVYIVGHSLGAQGALYMTQKEDCFAAQGLLSGYPAYTTMDNSNIPTKCFVGTVASGEDTKSVDFTLSYLSSFFGESNISIINCSHRDVPKLVFTMDEDNDNQSDFVNWLLKQRK